MRKDKRRIKTIFGTGMRARGCLQPVMLRLSVLSTSASLNEWLGGNPKSEFFWKRASFFVDDGFCQEHLQTQAQSVMKPQVAQRKARTCCQREH